MISSLSLGARNQYVDVMNPKPTSSASVPSNLFSTLPNSHSAPAIFNPMGGSSGKYTTNIKHAHAHQRPKRRKKS